jgi:hypothetical protein
MPPLVAVLIQQMPSIVAFAKALFAQADPTAPLPTDAEVIAAYQAALASSLAKDADWLASHGE